MDTASLKSETSTTGWFDWLGPVRMLIIALIAFGYASTMPRGPDQQEYLHLFGYDPSWYGISLLFMISGFLAMRSLARHGSASKFLLSRIRSNIPALAIFASLVLFVLYPIFGVPPEDGTSRVAQHAAYFLRVVSCFDPNTVTPGLLDNALYACIIQGGLWTFRWGAIAYVITALVWALGGLRNRQLILAAFAVSLTASIAAILYGIRGGESQTLGLLTTGLRLAWPFLLGMCAFAYRDVLPRRLIVPMALLVAAALQFYFLPWTPFIEICVTIAFGYFVYLLISSGANAPKAIRKLPDVSLGLYIFNWPAAQLTLLAMPDLTPFSLFAVSFPITVALAAGLYSVSRLWLPSPGLPKAAQPA